MDTELWLSLLGFNWFFRKGISSSGAHTSSVVYSTCNRDRRLLLLLLLLLLMPVSLLKLPFDAFSGLREYLSRVLIISSSFFGTSLISSRPIHRKFETILGTSSFNTIVFFTTSDKLASNTTFPIASFTKCGSAKKALIMPMDKYVLKGCIARNKSSLSL